MKTNNFSSTPPKPNQKDFSSQKKKPDSESKIDSLETRKTTEINENRSFLDYYMTETNGDR